MLVAVLLLVAINGMLARRGLIVRLAGPDHLVLAESALPHGSLASPREPSSQVSAGPKITGQATDCYAR